MRGFLILATLLVVALVRSQQTPVCKAPPNDENLQECCDVPTLTHDPNYAHCLSQYGYEGHIPNNCVAGCFINETKILVNGTIDATVLKNVTQHINNGIEDWDPIIEKSVKSCITKYNLTLSSPLDSCDVVYVKLAKCIFQTNFASCPDKLLKRSPGCDELKTHAEGCFIASED